MKGINDTQNKRKMFNNRNSKSISYKPKFNKTFHGKQRKL